MMDKESGLNNEIEELIIKVLSGTATNSEIRSLDHWVRQTDENQHYFLRFRDSWYSLSQIKTPNKTRTLEALNEVNRKITGLPVYEVAESGTRLLPSHTYSPPKFLRTAALWLLLLGMGAVFILLIQKYTGNFKISYTAQVESPRGSKAFTTLPDGTTVWLNAGSQLEYKISAGKPVRNVSLAGEAYFNVARDPDHPFSVNAGSMIIKAYGTEFNVKAYPEEKKVETTLIEGSVSVEIRNKPNNKTVLKPNEQAVYYSPSEGRSENFLVTKGIDPAYYALWIKDKLQIKGEKLEDLAVMLERKYDVTIHFNDMDLKDLRFTGIIENETIEQILELIKISSNVEYAMDGREVWLSKSRKRN
jgi:transmembrane sensor